MFDRLTNYLRSLSPESKSRLIFAAVTVVGLGLGTVWIKTLPDRLQNLGAAEIITPEDTGSVLSATNRIEIEAAETKDQKTYLYFKVSNETEDIMAFAPADMIYLEIGKKTFKPSQVLDRQDKAFNKKILSDTTAYGVMIFEEIGDDEGQLTLDNMYFEQSPTNLFKESINVDFETLKPLKELRS